MSDEKRLDLTKEWPSAPALPITHVEPKYKKDPLRYEALRAVIEAMKQAHPGLTDEMIFAYLDEL
jgi:hypothetical protein